MPPATLIIRHCRQLITCAGPAPRAGAALGALDIISDGSLAAAGDVVLFAGPDRDLPATLPLAPDVVTLEAPDCSLVPGFVDPHTHAVFAGDRRGELQQRLGGATYADIAAAGGGIAATVRATRAASEDALVEAARPRLDAMLAHGTTTCEIKSGYGLDVESELTQLRAIRRLAATHAVEVVPTFMGAHEVPVEYRGRRDRYLRLVTSEMLPAVRDEGLAEWCDVFCEAGVFTAAESRAVLEAGAAAGLRPRIHADEFAPSGGCDVAAAVGARSADHLVHADGRGIAALAGGGVAATLLPIAAFYLKLGRFAPARALIAAGVPVALATDLNPGAGWSPSMPFAMALACFGMDLTFAEALTAATINAAWTLDRAGTVGSLEPGKQADAVLVRGDAVDLLRVGDEPLAAVVKRGRLIAPPSASSAAGAAGRSVLL